MNYVISNVKGRRKQYVDMKNGDPDSITKINERMLTLDQYHTLARRIICKWAPSYAKATMLNSEDAIDYVAHRIMIGDWNYTKDRSDIKTYRGYCGKKAISKYLGVVTNQKKISPITNFDVPNDLQGSIYDTIPDLKSPRADSRIEADEDYDRTKRRLLDLMADLSDTQRACIIMHHIEEIPMAEIARRLGMSTEGVRRSIEKALVILRAKKE